MKKSNLFFILIIILFFMLFLTFVFQDKKTSEIIDEKISTAKKIENKFDLSEAKVLAADKKDDPTDFIENDTDSISNTIDKEKDPIQFVNINVFVKGGEREKNNKFDMYIEFFTPDELEKIHEVEATFFNSKFNSILVPKGNYYVTIEYDNRLEWEKVHTNSKGERLGCQYKVDFSLFYEGTLFFIEKHLLMVHLKKEDEYINYIPNSWPKTPYEVTRKWVISNVSIMFPK